MYAQPRLLDRGFSLAGKLLLGLLAVACLTETACPQVPPPAVDGSRAGAVARPAAAPALAFHPDSYDVNPRPLTQIPPGTIIDKDAPKGWTHLIIKSQPRIGAGDTDKINDQIRQFASFLFTSIVARVQGEQAGGQVRFRLTDIGVGMGTNVGGKDIIITPETQKQLGANLGFVARIVLSEAQARVRQVLVVARSDTFALIDAPGLIVQGGKHRPMVIRYALLVDPATGRLDTLAWPIERDARGAYLNLIGDYEWLQPSKQEDCVLHVDANEFNVVGVPSEKAFAMNRFLQGQKQVAIPEQARALVSRGRLNRAMAAELEAHLRQVLQVIAGK